MFNRLAFSLLLVCAAAAPSFCGNDIYLRLNPEVKGGVSSGKIHKDWIAVVSVQNAGKLQEMGPIVIGKKIDAATPALEKACASGTSFTEARIEVCKTGAEQRYLLITLTKLVITQIRQNIVAADDASAAAEELTCTYDKIEWTYAGAKQDGSSLPEVKTEWDNTTSSGK